MRDDAASETGFSGDLGHGAATLVAEPEEAPATAQPNQVRGGGDGFGIGGGDEPGRIPRSQAKGIAWLPVPLLAIVGFVLAVLAAFDVRIFGPKTVEIAGVALVLLSAAAAGATITAILVERFGKDWTPFDPLTCLWFLLAGGVLTAFTVWGVWWLLFDADLASGTKAFITIVLAVCALLGAGATLLATYPKVLTRTGTVIVLSGVRGLVGLALGAALAIGPVIAVGFVRTQQANVTLPEPPVITMPVDHYVALGDSYSAGEGLEPYEQGTQNLDQGGNRCHRSSSAYAQQLRFSVKPETEIFVACAGAVTSDLFTGHTEPRSDPNGASVPAQVDPNSPKDAAVDLVTLTMGGNDVGFSKVVTRCLEVDDCTNQPFDPDGNHPGLTMQEWAKLRATELAADLGSAYAQLRAHYPSARIVVLGYPYLFPTGEPGIRFSDCDTILRRVSSGERTQLRQLQDDVTALIYKQAVAADVEFVSPQAVWDGHEPCGDRGQYTNAINPIVFDGSFHPNLAGQRAYATLLACYLDATTRPAPMQPVRLPWETTVNDSAPAPGSLARPVPCPAATQSS